MRAVLSVATLLLAVPASAQKAAAPAELLRTDHEAGRPGGRLVYAVRSAREGIDVLAFGGALPDTGASTVLRLGDEPLAARDMLLERLAAQQAAPAAHQARLATVPAGDGEIVVARRHTAALPF